MPSLYITLETDKISLLDEISGDDPHSDQREIIPGISVQITHKSFKRGFFESTIDVSLILTIASGIPVSLISAYIYDKLIKKARRIELEQVDITRYTKDDVIKIVIKKLKKVDS